MDRELNKLAEHVISEMKAAAQRAGRDDLAGLCCYFCGRSTVDVKLARCSCSFPESFGCGVRGRRVCPECEAAHKQVAAHLTKLFAAPVVNRVNARRAQLRRELSRAVRALYDEDANPTECPLFLEIAQCDEFDQETERFRKDLLRCFSETNFLMFQSLARELHKQADESFIRAAIRSGFCR